MALKVWQEGVDYIRTPTESCPNCNVPTIRGIEVIVARVLQLAMDLVVFIMFAYLVYGGFLWLTAGSDDQKVSQAKKTITYSILGLVILIGGFILLRAIEAITGVQFHIFKIYFSND